MKKAFDRKLTTIPPEDGIRKGIHWFAHSIQESAIFDLFMNDSISSRLKARYSLSFLIIVYAILILASA